MNSNGYGAISMKSILQSIALLSAAVLIASCDSSSGGGASAVTITPAPQVGASGSGVKGIIDGAAVTITDADGDQIASSIVLNGTYDMVFDEAAVAAGITSPITVTIAGAGATTVCDFVNSDSSGNDCATGLTADPFVAFGESYALDSAFTLSGVIPAQTGGTDPTNVSHVSPASDIALKKAIEKAAGATLTAAAALEANRALSGLIQAITGIDLGGLDVTQIATANIAQTGAVTSNDAQLAVAAFASAIVGSQQSGESLNATITRLAGTFTIDADGNVAGTGADLAILSSAVANGLQVVAAKRPSGAISNAVANATAQTAAFVSIGAGTVKISPPAAADSTEPVDLTKAFVTKLGAVIGELVSSTGAQGFGGQVNASATEAFTNELDAIAAVNSTNATLAFTKLDAAVKTAAAALEVGATVTNDVETENDDGIAFTLTKADDGSVTATGVSSRWPLIEATDGNTVTLTGDTGTSTTSVFSIPAVTLTTTSGTTTLQTFTGSASSAAGTVTGTSDLALSGSVTGQSAGVSLAIALTASGVPDASITGEATTAGTYTAAFTFSSTATNDVSLSLSGTIGASTQSYAVTTPSGTISGSVARTGNVDVNKLTDGNAVLTLTLTNGSVASTGDIGTFTVPSASTSTSTGTLAADGTVTYSDDTIQFHLLHHGIHMV
jgi:hypothetical protein